MNPSIMNSKFVLFMVWTRSMDVIEKHEMVRSIHGVD